MFQERVWNAWEAFVACCMNGFDMFVGIQATIEIECILVMFPTVFGMCFGMCLKCSRDVFGMCLVPSLVCPGYVFGMPLEWCWYVSETYV